MYAGTCAGVSAGRGEDRKDRAMGLANAGLRVTNVRLRLAERTMGNESRLAVGCVDCWG
jgi:hypothetical protein